jgi:hypothetical protein
LTNQKLKSIIKLKERRLPMDMETLLELKRQYELELIRAEAKVTVINDIISSQKPTPEYEQTVLSDATEENPTNY